MDRRVHLALIVLWIALPLGSLAAENKAEEAATPAGYIIGPRDLIVIQVFEVPELNIERRVSETGSLELPLIGTVLVQGLSERDLADKLRSLLESRYVQRASVTVQVKEFRSKPISIIGAVKTPGPLALAGTWTLIEALSAAGGLSENHGNVVYVLRQAENGRTDRMTVDLDDLLQRGNPESNIPIVGGDLINVPATAEVTVSCLGEVARGGALVFKSTERITLLAAIARAGGLTDRASRKIMIRRKGASDQSERFVVDYKRIVAGKDPDVELQQDDIVLVRQSFF